MKNWGIELCVPLNLYFSQFQFDIFIMFMFYPMLIKLWILQNSIIVFRTNFDLFMFLGGYNIIFREFVILPGTKFWFAAHWDSNSRTVHGESFWWCMWSRCRWVLIRWSDVLCTASVSSDRVNGDEEQVQRRCGPHWSNRQHPHNSHLKPNLILIISRFLKIIDC